MRRRPADRVLATVLFTDIVGSTERAADLGDRRWRELVARHHAVVRAQLRRFRGREVDTAGDGFLAAFDRPAQAIECARAIVAGLQPLGLTIRAGVHAGELEVGADGRLGGIAVHTAARVVASAGPGEIMVTATVRDLVAGSQIEFEDRGTTTLKGVPGEWRLFAVVSPAVEQLPVETPDAGVERPAPAVRPRLLWPVVAAVAVVAVLGLTAALAAPQLFPSPVVPTSHTVGRVNAAGTGFDLSAGVGTDPIGLTAGAGAVWAINFGSETLSKIDPTSGRTIENEAVGGAPSAVAFGADAVWVTTGYGLSSGAAGDLARYIPGLSEFQSRIGIGTGGAAVAFGEGSVWVAHGLRETVLRIDPATDSVEHEAEVASGPAAIAVGFGSVWVGSSLEGVVERLDPLTYEVTARITTGPVTTIATGAGAVWITSETTDTLVRIDPATGTHTTFELSDGPRGVVAVGGDVWVAAGRDGEVVRFDPAANRVVARLSVDGFPDAMALDEGERVWVAVRDP